MLNGRDEAEVDINGHMRVVLFSQKSLRVKVGKNISVDFYEKKKDAFSLKLLILVLFQSTCCFLWYFYSHYTLT